MCNEEYLEVPNFVYYDIVLNSPYVTLKKKKLKNRTLIYRYYNHYLKDFSK